MPASTGSRTAWYAPPAPERSNSATSISSRTRSRALPSESRTFAAGCTASTRRARLHIGADCAIEIWRRTPGEAWFGRLLGLPGLRQVTRLAYDRFADLLYAWNRRKGHW